MFWQPLRSQWSIDKLSYKYACHREFLPHEAAPENGIHERIIGARALAAMTFAGPAHADTAIPKALNMPLVSQAGLSTQYENADERNPSAFLITPPRVP
jgi:hypothetical protein